MKNKFEVYGLLCLGLLLVAILVDPTRGQKSAMQIFTLTEEQEEILGHMSIVFLDDGQGGTTKTIRLTGVNVQVVNGLGATNGFPLDPTTNDTALATTNGLGNIIVGYNEQSVVLDDRTGSHNVIVGKEQAYSSYGGAAVGDDNAITGAYASITGGKSNLASGNHSWVGGGGSLISTLGNEASGTGAAISGGMDNLASGDWSSIGGGDGNTASGLSSCIGGGHDNLASGLCASAHGGSGNEASGSFSTVSGGEDNLAGLDGLGNLGAHATVCGGRDNMAIDSWCTVGGGSSNVAGDTSSVLNALQATVSGGCSNTAGSSCAHSP